MNLLKVRWIEFVYAYWKGAPVKTRSGKTYHRQIGQVAQRVLDRSLWGIDISKWQGTVDFVKVKAMGIRFLILRASYGIRPDEKFTSYIASAITGFIGWLFGVYHYYDPQYSPQDQANALFTAIRPYRRYIKRVWIDLEFTWSGNYTASTHWKAFAELVRADGWLIGFYTRKTWWDSRVGNLASWFSGYPLWAAQYSSALTLIPTGWTKAHIWQDGTPTLGGPGTAFPDSYEIDHNIADDEFYRTEFSDTDVTTTPYNGIVSVKGERYGQKIYVKKCSPNVRARVVNEYSRPSVIANREGAAVAWNGAAWNRLTGVIETNEYALLILNSGFAVGNRYTTPNIQASSIVRPLIVNGINVAGTSGDLKWTEVHARSGMFVSRDGGIVHVTVDGDFVYAGVTLWQLAQIALEFGAWNGGDHGGGGDSVEVESGIVVSVPDDESNGVHGERAVPQTILVFENGDSTMRYEAVSANTMSIRNDHSVYGERIRQDPAGTVWRSDNLWVAPADGDLVKRGDQWLEVAPGQWVAIIHLGDRYCTLTDHGVPPPPPSGEPAVMEIMLADGSAVIIRDAQGNELFKWP